MKKLGIIVAKTEEALPFIDRLYALPKFKDFSATVVISGIGRSHSAQAVNDLSSVDKVDHILNIGTCVGRGNLSVGEIVTVSRVYNTLYRSFRESEKLKVGEYVDIDQGKDFFMKSLPCFTVKEFSKKEIEEDIQDYIVDREYYAIASECQRLNIPTTAIKIVSTISKNNPMKEYGQNLESSMDILIDYLLYGIFRKYLE